jgi:hypothetical protein
MSNYDNGRDITKELIAWAIGTAIIIFVVHLVLTSTNLL